MAQATVKTVQYLDTRIEPQPDPVYDYVIGPTQNQYYKIPASGLSDSSINFNNLTTLGIDRAYLDTFEIEITAKFDFISKVYNPAAPTAATDTGSRIISISDAFDPNYAADIIQAASYGNCLCPKPDEWTFDSFPFNKCCSEARVNINGGSFFSQPLCYVRAKERYMNQHALAKCYENVCPCFKPLTQTESGKRYNGAVYAYTSPKQISDTDLAHADDYAEFFMDDGQFTAGSAASAFSAKNPVQEAWSYTRHSTEFDTPMKYPTRLANARNFAMQSAEGYEGGFNNSIVRLGTVEERQIEGYTTKTPNYKVKKYKNYYSEVGADGELHTYVTVTWREPIFCSPFSSRYDASYGRPLYNITSMDLSFTMMDLGNMIRVCNIGPPLPIISHNDPSRVSYYMPRPFVDSYTVHITSAQLCYQVMTIPPILNKPLTTLVPYRRFVPYVTDYTLGNQTNGAAQANIVPINGDEITIKTGIYTLNEIPTAIWLFVAPTKADLQTNLPDIYEVADQTSLWARNRYNLNARGNFDTNKLFGYIRKVEISMANTTQILSTAEPVDLYRIAKANGCEDSYASWSGDDIIGCGLESFNSRIIYDAANHEGIRLRECPVPSFMGAGSVLRLKPGVDLIVPDQPLIPGANGNNMVFQATVTARVPPHSANHAAYSAWLLFEYVGVAAISPGQCEITMNPLGSGEVVAVSPVMSATSESTEGKIEGSGHWDKTKEAARIAGQIADDGIISMILKRIPGASGALDWAKKHGLGEPCSKKARGGAVMGKGLNDWV